MHKGDEKCISYELDAAKMCLLTSLLSLRMGFLGSRENGGQNNQGAWSRVEKGLGSRGSNLGSRGKSLGSR